MKCPVDGATLAMTERHGVEIDYCPDCRGVWLDRGELDRIVENARGDERTHDADQNDRAERQRNGGRRKSRFSALTEMLGGGGED